MFVGNGNEAALSSRIISPKMGEKAFHSRRISSLEIRQFRREM